MKTERKPDRYDRMIYRRVGKSGLKLPVIHSGFGRISGIPATLAAHPRSSPTLSMRVSPTLILQTITGHRPAQLKPCLARF
jgi:hypothetical protein